MFVVLRTIVNFYRTNLWDISVGSWEIHSFYRYPRMNHSYWKHTWLSTFCAELNLEIEDEKSHLIIRFRYFIQKEIFLYKTIQFG